MAKTIRFGFILVMVILISASAGIGLNFTENVVPADHAYLQFEGYVQNVSLAPTMQDALHNLSAAVNTTAAFNENVWTSMSNQQNQRFANLLTYHSLHDLKIASVTFLLQLESSNGAPVQAYEWIAGVALSILVGVSLLALYMSGDDTVIGMCLRNVYKY